MNKEEEKEVTPLSIEEIDNVSMVNSKENIDAIDYFKKVYTIIYDCMSFKS